MTLAGLLAYLGTIGAAVVLWQVATQRALSLLQPEGRADPSGSDTIRAKRPDPFRLL